MRITVLILVGLLTCMAFSFIGCASIIHGSKQSVTFQSTPAGASVEVSDAMGVNYGGCMTPCTLDLKRKREYLVKIYKSGHDPVEMVLKRKSDGWIWGNLFFGGVIGIIIDFSSGAAYKLSPTELHTTLPTASQGNMPDDQTKNGIVFFDFDNLTPEEQAALSKMEKIDWPLDSI